MKAAFLSELAIVRTFVLSFIGILAFVFVFICWTMESAAGAAAVVCAMTPMLIMFSLMGYDDQNGWLRYRAALPFARRDIITSRYATILACAAAVIVCASVLGIALNGALPRFLEGFEAAGPIEIISSSVAATMVVLIIAAIAEPFLVKFGNTKGIRYLMCAFILAGCIDVVILTNLLAPTSCNRSSRGSTRTAGLCSSPSSSSPSPSTPRAVLSASKSSRRKTFRKSRGRAVCPSS
mgnify:CR=1 FL=1